MRRTIFLSVTALLMSMSSAFAAADDELAKKCVIGSKITTPTQAQFSYLPGGTVEGFKRTPKTFVPQKGTWELKSAVLSQHINGEPDSSFPIRIADNGTCLFTEDGKEFPMQH
jgi:hypothetical protein